MTIAQSIYTRFKTATKTVSIATLALRANATIYKQWDKIVYEFDDGSSLVTTGRGRSHRVVVNDE